jgi:hypothetical protein
MIGHFLYNFWMRLRRHFSDLAESYLFRLQLLFTSGGQKTVYHGCSCKLPSARLQNMTYHNCSSSGIPPWRSSHVAPRAAKGPPSLPPFSYCDVIYISVSVYICVLLLPFLPPHLSTTQHSISCISLRTMTRGSGNLYKMSEKSETNPNFNCFSYFYLQAKVEG